MQSNIVISGVGGQGVITLGLMISQIAISQGENVVMSEIHGLAQRGGSVSVDIRIGDFHAPIIPTGDVDLTIGMEPIEARRVLDRARKGSRVIVSTERMVPVSLSIRHQEYPDIEGILSEMSTDFEVREIDAVSIAEESGNYKSANMAVLGFAIGTGWLPLDIGKARKQMARAFPKKVLEINLKAFDAGLKLAGMETRLAH